MSLISLLYVSNAKLGSDRDAALASILNWSQGYNAAMGISGTLVFTGAHFAQILEGEAAALRQLFANIRVDSRHLDVVVLKEWSIDERLFQDWALAYAGPSAYVARVIGKPLAEVLCGATPDIGQLVRLMVQFAATDGTKRSAE